MPTVCNNVILGEADWLFLHEGSNLSFSQITGKKRLTPSALKTWGSVLSFRKKCFGDRYLTLICAEKTCVYPSRIETGFLPHQDRPIEMLRRLNPEIIYPCYDLLYPDRIPTAYSRTDTHYTDFGAYHVGRMIASLFGINSTTPEPSWREIPILGDLGLKCNPQLRSVNYVADAPLASMKIIDNGLRNRGRVTIYKSDADHEATLLLFGDSFSGINLGRMLACFFRRVIFCHSGSIDYGLIDRVSPDYIVAEYAERFLTEPPHEGLSIASVIASKLIESQFTDEMLSLFTASLTDHQEIYGAEGMKLIDRALNVSRPPPP